MWFVSLVWGWRQPATQSHQPHYHAGMLELASRYNPSETTLV